MRGKFHTIVNNTWYSSLFDHKLTKLFSIENFSGAKHAGKVLIIIIILFLIIIIGDNNSSFLPFHFTQFTELFVFEWMTVGLL